MKNRRLTRAAPKRGRERWSVFASGLKAEFVWQPLCNDPSQYPTSLIASVREKNSDADSELPLNPCNCKAPFLPSKLRSGRTTKIVKAEVAINPETIRELGRKLSVM
jgi:hypothetical protein